MPKASLLTVFGLAGFLAGPVQATESVRYDVPPGQYVELYGGSVTTHLFVGCDFAVDDTYSGTDWPSSLAIVFSTSEKDSESEELVKLEAVRPSDGGGWRYWFTIVEAEDRNTQIVAFPQRSDSVLRLSMAREWEGTFLFLVGDEQDITSVANVSRLSMKSWSVIASGVRGNAFCFNDPTGMPNP